MNDLPAPISECELRDKADFDQTVRAAARPVVLRGLAAEWPTVRAASASPQAALDLLKRHGALARTVTALSAPPEAGGRLFYNARLTGFNFERRQQPLDEFLLDLEAVMAAIESRRTLAIQSEPLAGLFPTIAAEAAMPLFEGVAPNVWIGSALRVAPHYDLMDNIACNVIGRRRFTLFPPAAIGGLYPGPFELTPAGTPVSMVDLAAPDFTAFPRFGEALALAQSATLDPGDAIYIPYGWWHGVESLDPVNLLVNYWTSAADPELASPYDALLLARMALAHLPADQRAVWRSMMDHYVFGMYSDPAAHLPEHARGMLGAPSRPLLMRLRGMLRERLG